MAEQLSPLGSGGPEAARRLTPPRAGAIAIVALLPAAIGLFHLFVHPLVPRSGRAITTTFPLVFGSCIVACLVLGLLDVSYAAVFAFLQACVCTLAYVVSDGVAAFLGPIVFTLLPFWPLIGLGKIIRRAFHR
jgi:hypothetical protein